MIASDALMDLRASEKVAVVRSQPHRNRSHLIEVVVDLTVDLADTTGIRGEVAEQVMCGGAVGALIVERRVCRAGVETLGDDMDVRAAMRQLHELDETAHSRSSDGNELSLDVMVLSGPSAHHHRHEQEEREERGCLLHDVPPRCE